MMSQKHDRDKDVILRPDFECAPNEEALAIDAAAHRPLLHQQSAYQKAAEYKENLDSDPAEMRKATERKDGPQQRIAVVIVEDEQDRDAADEVEFDLSARRGWARLPGMTCHGHNNLVMDRRKR